MKLWNVPFAIPFAHSHTTYSKRLQAMKYFLFHNAMKLDFIIIIIIRVVGVLGVVFSLLIKVKSAPCFVSPERRVNSKIPLIITKDRLKWEVSFESFVVLQTAQQKRKAFSHFLDYVFILLFFVFFPISLVHLSRIMVTTIQIKKEICRHQH